MRRKQLKIIILSVLMVAATPRAMSNFNGYADAFYHKAETEWLHFLLTFSQDEGSESKPATTNQTQEESACLRQMVAGVRPVNARPAVDIKRTSRAIKDRDRSYDVAQAITPSTGSDVEKESTDSKEQIDREARRHASGIMTLLDEPAVIERNGRAKTEFLRVLFRSIKRGDGKAVRALERELTSGGRAKSPSSVSVPVRFDWNTDKSPEVKTDVVIEEIAVDHDSSVESMLDAR